MFLKKRFETGCKEEMSHLETSLSSFQALIKRWNSAASVVFRSLQYSWIGSRSMMWLNIRQVNSNFK